MNQVTRLWCVIAAVSFGAMALRPSGPSGERVLVTGGSGYLAQFVIESLESDGVHSCAYTVRSPDKSLAGVSSPAFVVTDLATDAAGVELAVKAFNPTVVVHAAARSSPRECEADEAGAIATNSPQLLLDTLARHAPDVFVVYVSTDQVYDGAPPGHPPYSDGAAAKPRNAYGRSKLKFEEALHESKLFSHRHVVLRSSNMIGPRAPYTKAGKFLQWVGGSLLRSSTNGEGNNVSLFDDEWRSFVAVSDVVRAVRAAIALRTTPSSVLPPLNCGGPDRLSRAELGALVANALGVDRSRISAVSAATVDVGYPSPPDLAMTSRGLSEVLGIVDMTPAQTVVEAACAELVEEAVTGRNEL